jgi:hypothetical protein
MDLAALSRGRRILSAAVALSAVGLVSVETRVGAEAADERVAGWVLASGFLISLGLLIVVWRKEHAASELAFAARQAQQLALLKLQADLHKRGKAAPSGSTAPGDVDGQA